MITSDELTENLSPFELSLFLEKKLHEENHNLETLLNAGEAILIGQHQHQGKPFFIRSICYKRNVKRGERTNGWYDSAKFW